MVSLGHNELMVLYEGDLLADFHYKQRVVMFWCFLWSYIYNIYQHHFLRCSFAHCHEIIISPTTNFIDSYSLQIHVYITVKDQSHGSIGRTVGPSSPGQARVPLMIFQSNSKFDQNLQRSGLKSSLLITTKFCTNQNSITYCRNKCKFLLWLVE